MLSAPRDNVAQEVLVPYRVPGQVTLEWAILVEPGGAHGVGDGGTQRGVGGRVLAVLREEVLQLGQLLV